MAEIIKESQRIYHLNIWTPGQQWYEGVQVNTDEYGELLAHLNESLSERDKIGLATYMANPDTYEISLKLAYTQGATIRCQCGAAHELDGRGDSDCEACGQPYNTFGQELRRGAVRFTGREGDEDERDEDERDEDDSDERNYYDSDDDY